MVLQTNASQVTVGIATFAGAATVVYGLYHWMNKTRWIKVGRVSEAWIFPIKSCRRKVVDSFLCTDIGAVYKNISDRRFMIIEAGTNKMQTAREFGRLELVVADIDDQNWLTISDYSNPNSPTIRVDLASVKAQGNLVEAKFWRDIPVPCYDCGDEASDWFCQFLDQSNGRYRLVYLAEILQPRTVNDDEKYALHFNDKDQATLQDLCAYHCLCQSSVDELNNRIVSAENDKISALHFRPNFVIEGTKPFDEDQWDEMAVGEVIFYVNKPCHRCVLTTVNPETGIASAANEPLRTLQKFRMGPPNKRKENYYSPLLGLNMTLLKPGEVKIGDEVYVKYSSRVAKKFL